LIEIKGMNILVLSILAYFFGDFLTKKFRFLDNWHIPKGVTGGIPLAIFFCICTKYAGKSFAFDNNLRDFFLLCFFCTTGMLLDFNKLIKYGFVSLKLIIVLFVFLILQNVVGVFAAKIFGRELIDGLILGTITLAQGHGAGISWGSYFEKLGYSGSLNLAMINATLGLISGAMIGGPVSKSLIRKFYLRSEEKIGEVRINKRKNFAIIVSSTPLFLKTILLILGIIIIACATNNFLSLYGLVCPDYLPVMFLATIIAISSGKKSKSFFNNEKVKLLNNVSLQVFISITILSIDIGLLFDPNMIDVLCILFFQIIFIVLYAKWIFFKYAGRDYNSAVLTSGFIGVGLGATPIGLANMEAITKKYGESQKAFILLPILYSACINLLNGIVVSFFLIFIL